MADVFEKERLFSAAAAMAHLPRAGGKRYAVLFRHGSLQLQIYAPRGRDSQRPHARDEVYVVAQGSGTYVNCGERIAFKPGDCLFAAAGEEHHFEDFSGDFFTWVFFYGPEGGEAGTSESSPEKGADREPGWLP